jgi:hypothetical protein
MSRLFLLLKLNYLFVFYDFVAVDVQYVELIWNPLGKVIVHLIINNVQELWKHLNQ